jgi:hypothetical protein
MAYEFSEIFEAQAMRIDREAAQANADLEAARLADDPSSTMALSQRILELDAQRNALVTRANAFVRQSQSQAAHLAGDEDLSREDAALVRKYGIKPGDLAIAKNWTTAGNMTVTEKVETYLRNAQRLREDRANGRYRDDQGRVTR